jgi:DNA polymerase III subunit epsilon
MRVLFYDTETTGLPNRNRSLWYPTQPYVAQLAYLLDDGGEVIDQTDILVQPYDKHWKMSPKSQEIHGKTREMCEAEGVPMPVMLDQFIDAVTEADVLVCHNVGFDKLLMAMQAAKIDKDMDHYNIFEGKKHVCTMLAALPICKIPPKDGRKNSYKWPTLQELHKFLFGEEFDGAHDALADITATRRCWIELANMGALDAPFEKIGMEAPRYG